MKSLKIIAAFVALLLNAFLPAYSDTNSASVNIDGLPNTGTYYIISAANNQALQPNAPTLGQNVFLFEYNRGGTQKWKINRKIDPVTHQPTNRYTIRLAGENEDLNFQPHPSVSDATAIIGLDKAVFILEPTAGGVLVKSAEKNGDAMFTFQTSPNAELHFGPSDGSSKFRWNFVSTDGAPGATVSVADPLPNTGTYFIINSSSHDALQPNSPSLGQTVFLSGYTKGGTQKWSISRQIDPVTNRPTNRYTIRLAGENEALNFQPHPSVGDAAPILGSDKAVFQLEPSGDALVVKSVEKNGDAMYAFKGDDSEPLFGPDDGSKKFRWNFISTD